MVNKALREPTRPASVAVPQTPLPEKEPTMTDPSRPPRQTENENQRTPAHEGEAPRPATEPRGGEGSSNSGDTATDPATGRPNP
jgi:hypothetical protein